MKKLYFTAGLLACFLTGSAQNPFENGRLKAGNHYLTHTKNNKPFFWLGDTAWELFHRLNREESERYLKRRAEQGFTVIQAVALAELDGLNTPNANGDKPLIDNDPTRPNDAYFRHVDYVLETAERYGLAIGLLPTWGDKLNKSTWGKGPEIFNAENARAYGRWIGNRYKDRNNIIWILGGDRNPRDGSQDVAVWRAMAEGITQGVGGADKALITYHPQPNGLEEGGSSKWFHNDAWLDFNMLQNGHCRDTETYAKITFAYNRTPAKPVIDGEPIYEDHPVCFNAKDLGTSNAHDVRRYAYLDLFAGAFGHTYGCHDIWQMYAPGREPVNNPHMAWHEALELPGANQMRFVRSLMESRPIDERTPDQSLVVEASNGPADRIQATRGRAYAFIYTAAGRPFTVNMGKIGGNEVIANWYDPRTGKTQSAGTFANTGQQKFTPPRSGYGQDWVLILDNAAMRYGMPVAVK